MRSVAQRAKPRGLLAVGTFLGFLVTLGAVFPTGALADDKPTPPTRSPFEGPIGGARLGNTDEVVYSAGDVPAPPEVAAQAYLVADLDTGDVYAAKNAHQRLRPASTLKTLTALTLLPRLDSSAVYTATEQDAAVEGSKAGLRPGQDYTVEQLFYALLLPSGNDAASALAAANRGAQNTVEQMSEEARRLGAYDTTVENPSGLDADGQFSSAYDLALFGRAAMENEEFVRYVTTPTVQFPGKGDSTEQLRNTNDLLEQYAGAFGVKSGYTSKAGHTVIGAAERGDQRLLVVLLGSDQNYAQHAASLLDWGFDPSSLVDDPALPGVDHPDTPEKPADGEPGTAKPVGQLIQPVDVERATDGDSGGASRSSRAVDATIGPADREIAQKPPPERLAAAAVGMLNTPTVLLLAGWLIFIVLASLRVRSYVRGHRQR